MAGREERREGGTEGGRNRESEGPARSLLDSIRLYGRERADSKL